MKKYNIITINKTLGNLHHEYYIHVFYLKPIDSLQKTTAVL